MIAYALGQSRLSDAFNLANSTPNIVHDLVLGGVLGATFVPVFVNQLAKSSRRAAIESISAVVTLAGVVLLVTTGLFELLSPAIIHHYTFGSASTPTQMAEQRLAIELLRLFAPQLLFYGAISLMGAVLATEDRFIAVGFVPILNNLVGITVLGIFAVAAHASSVDALTNNTSMLWLLGLGTTAGVAIQAAALVPSLRRLSFHLQFRWRPSDPAVKNIVALSGWTFGFVLTNQVAVFVILALEYHLGAGKVSAYTYAFVFFQFPFGVAASAIVNVATPDLARAWNAGDLSLVGRRLGTALKQLLAVILPSMAAYLVLARPAVTLLLLRGQETLSDTHLTAAVLVLFALGLPGFCTFFLATRTLQAMRDTRTVFWLYVLENGLNIGVAFALYKKLGVQGLALSYSIAYFVAALVALVLLRDRLGNIGGRAILTSSLRAFGMAIVMAVVIAFVVTLTGTSSGILGWIKLGFAVGIGGLTYLGGAGLAGTLSARGTQRRVPRHR
jgi:putative peptidoglycan lipid II flippase